MDWRIQGTKSGQESEYCFFPVRIKLGMVTELFIAQNKREVGYLNLGKMKLGKHGWSLVQSGEFGIRGMEAYGYCKDQYVLACIL